MKKPYYHQTTTKQLPSRGMYDVCQKDNETCLDTNTNVNPALLQIRCAYIARTPTPSNHTIQQTNKGPASKGQIGNCNEDHYNASKTR